jgi:methylmalonyl-CoA mutase, N-terminal domain
LERREKIVVGVNKYPMEDKKRIEYLRIDEEVERKQIARLKEVKANRNPDRVRRCLTELRQAAEGSANLMPFTLAAVKEYVTLQEICDVFRDVFGIYRDPGMF